jgi:hypothetical protein
MSRLTENWDAVRSSTAGDAYWDSAGEEADLVMPRGEAASVEEEVDVEIEELPDHSLSFRCGGGSPLISPCCCTG